MIGVESMKQAVILSAVRTPVGRFGGTLSQVTDRTLGALVIREAIARAGITPDQVEEARFFTAVSHRRITSQHGPSRGR